MNKSKAPQQMICVRGKNVFDQGAPAHEAYYVEDGRLSVTIEEDGVNVKLAEIGSGEIFGEMGILEKEVRMATVTALQSTTLTVISREDLEDRIGKIEDKYIKSLILTLIKRLRAANREQVRHYKNLAGFQNRMAGLSEKADLVISEGEREIFSAEVMPLLDKLDELLEKYRS